jgi:Fe-S-cluster-containing dehydrogenase component/DMSO reductase anchor subunit
MAYEFLFDANKCTGCHACAVACIIENDIDIEHSWRQIVSYNADHHPDFPLFHLSLACNHCDDTPCLKYCPAKAYSKDIETGIVVLITDYCIGCKYCTWVCLYEAPKYNENSGTVEKCTFCLHRLQVSKEPANVALCPIGALEICERTNNKIKKAHIPGFRDYNIYPGINIIPLNQDRQQPEMYSPEYANTVILGLYKNQQMKKSPKMTAKNEWTLLLISIVFPFLLALSSLTLFHDSESSLIPMIISGGIISLGLSILHFGNKKIAYRVILNFKKSWISRKVIFLSLFLFTLTLQLFITDMTALKITILLFGLLALFSIDKIYTVIPKTKPGNLNSTLVVLGTIYWYGILTLNFYVIGLIGTLRIYLYLNKGHEKLFASVSRLISRYFIPIIIVLTGYQYSAILIVGVVLIGEIIERYQFYKSIDILTPLRQMHIDEEFIYDSQTLNKVKETL